MGGVALQLQNYTCQPEQFPVALRPVAVGSLCGTDAGGRVSVWLPLDVTSRASRMSRMNSDSLMDRIHQACCSDSSVDGQNAGDGFVGNMSDPNLLSFYASILD